MNEEKDIKKQKNINTNKLKEFVSKPIFLNIVLILFQLIIILELVVFYTEYIKTAVALNYTLALILIVSIINNEQNNSYKLSWITIVAIFPVFGGILYAFLKLLPSVKGISKELKRQENLSNICRKKDVKNSNILISNLDDTDTAKSLLYFLQNSSKYPTYTDTKITYIDEGKKVFDSIIKDLKKAEKKIYMEFFIVSTGKILDEILSIFKEKAKNGVDIRFIYDGTNEFNLPNNFEKDLKNMGVKVEIFAKMTPIISTNQNNRDHRKIILIDDNIAYTGGINIADEYAGLKKRFGHWKDCGIKIEGRAVQSVCHQFAAIWNILSNDTIHYEDITEQQHKTYEEYKGLVTPFADAPNDNDRTGENIILHMINTAKKYVYITSPYFIVDDEVHQAMMFAAKRGVDIKIIVPEIPDKKIPFYVNQSYYPQLLMNKVQIYQYLPGFIHSKIYLCDDKIAMIGTVNMDYRSMYLHFENGVVLTNHDSYFDIKKDFLKVLSLSKKINLKYYKHLPWTNRFIGKVMRAFAPMM